MMIQAEEKTTRIDFVVTWVDGTDPEWQEQKARYLSTEDKLLNGESRYRDWDLFAYWFRSVERYAPWVGKIFLITEGHLPEWLNPHHEKLVVVRHSDYIPAEYLPTFNSNVIELNLHRLEGLSEHFVLFNDDTFLNGPIEPKDFFQHGLPRDVGIFSPQVPVRGGIASISLNNTEVINSYFTARQIVKEWPRKFFRFQYGKHLLKNLISLPWKDVLGFYDHHLPIAYRKSVFKELWTREETLLIQTSSHRFRTKEDVNHWLMRYWQLATGQFIPRSVHFGNYYNISEQLDTICEEIANPRYQVICLNDGDTISQFEEMKGRLQTVFHQRYPEASSFEQS